jgi:hypothetical protein
MPVLMLFLRIHVFQVVTFLHGIRPKLVGSAFIISPIYAACLVRLILLDLTILIYLMKATYYAADSFPNLPSLLLLHPFGPRTGPESYQVSRFMIHYFLIGMGHPRWRGI